MVLPSASLTYAFFQFVTAATSTYHGASDFAAGSSGPCTLIHFETSNNKLNGLS